MIFKFDWLRISELQYYEKNRCIRTNHCLKVIFHGSENYPNVPHKNINIENIYDKQTTRKDIRLYLGLFGLKHIYTNFKILDLGTRQLSMKYHS